jgi:hypothetical protein
MIVDKETQEKMAVGVIQGVVGVIVLKSVLAMADGNVMSKKEILDGYDEITGETLGRILDAFDAEIESHAPEMSCGIKKYKESFEQVFAKVKKDYLDAVT